MTINWKGVRYAIDPTTTCKRYEVALSHWAGGRSIWFWSKRKATARYRMAVENKEALFIVIYDWFKKRPSTSRDPISVEYWQDPDAEKYYVREGVLRRKRKS